MENPLTESVAKFYPDSAEPPKPTDEPVTKPEGQTPNQDGEKDGKPADDDQVIDQETDNDNPDEDAEGSAETDDDEDAQYIELDGEEHELNEIREWKQGHLRQADYTRKTQALAEERKAFEAERETERASLADQKKKISEQSDLLEVLVQEDSEIDWEALKADDIDLYVEKKELAEKRQKALDKIKADRATPFDDPATIQAEQKKLIESDPTWLEEKDGKKVISKKFEQDMQLINDYAMAAGFSPEEFSRMTKAHYLMTILEAAKYRELQKKAHKVGEKRSKVPVVTKPKANNKPSKSQGDIVNKFYPNG